MNWLVTIGGAIQVIVAGALFVFGLMIQSNVRKMKDEIMREVRTEFVSAAVSAQQYATTNLLLRNLTATVEGMRADLTGVGNKVAALEATIEAKGD